VEAAKLLSFTTGRTFQESLTDALYRSAVERRYDILGEASSLISSATQALWHSIKWVRITFSNMMINKYLRVDCAKGGNVAQNLLPALLPTL
jgi:uncharacterized protein with HEPN domain